MDLEQTLESSLLQQTNRPDVLDPALLRPGRFDRQITISRPDIKGRKAILEVHARNKKIDPKVTFNEIAKRTPWIHRCRFRKLIK